MQISLGYAATTTYTASSHFDDNIGAGFTTVFDGTYTIPGGGTPVPSGITIDVANTFNYDPSLGDLLVEIRVRNAAWSFQFAAGYEYGATTRIWNGQDGGWTSRMASSITASGWAPSSRSPADQQDNYTFQLSAAQSATIALDRPGWGQCQPGADQPDRHDPRPGRRRPREQCRPGDPQLRRADDGHLSPQGHRRRRGQYSLVVTRNADFDAESNNDLSTAQPLITNQASGAQWVIGYVGGGDGSAVRCTALLGSSSRLKPSWASATRRIRHGPGLSDRHWQRPGTCVFSQSPAARSPPRHDFVFLDGVNYADRWK